MRNHPGAEVINANWAIVIRRPVHEAWVQSSESSAIIGDAYPFGILRVTWSVLLAMTGIEYHVDKTYTLKAHLELRANHTIDTFA